MGKLAFILNFILAVFPSDATTSKTMCKLKDTNLGIRKLAFGEKRGKMAVYLTDGREVLVPISLFPDIKRLSSAQREDWMILDDQFFTFDAISRIYSVKDVLRV